MSTQHREVGWSERGQCEDGGLSEVDGGKQGGDQGQGRSFNELLG